MSIHVHTPEWPSLYDPLIEFHNFEHHGPIQANGRYIYAANDVFRFTFYWAVIFHAPFFIAAGALAFVNIVYPAHRDVHAAPVKAPLSPLIPLTPLLSARSPDPLLSAPRAPRAPREERPRNVHRSRLTFALLTLLVFVCACVGTALVESAVVGYLLVALCRAARFNISTWVPAIWALIITSSSMLGAFPLVIDRI
ncbi:hypothetical protein BV25DRAFT_1823539 [Artomyces pyxidatus]|uniref:Uncharacterized protein n=1 Tax=Artomyces pyxidatus TaxID=48021 RepID=A0ACB8T6A8_9AGAM|nr:hypothetical protein BV25DRAFT_1823539 [Artomyces pyxidatus]